MPILRQFSNVTCIFDCLEQCNVLGGDRQECGSMGVSKEECLNDLNCCWGGGSKCYQSLGK